MAWKSQIVAWLHEHKRYPEEPRLRRDEGVAQVFFSIDRQGPPARKACHPHTYFRGGVIRPSEVSVRLHCCSVPRRSPTATRGACQGSR